MLIDYPILKYPELYKKSVFTPLGNLVSKNGSIMNEEYIKYSNEKIQSEIQFKFLHCLHCFDKMTYSLKRRIYFYYIPKDIYDFICYKDNKILINDFVPEYFKKKVLNCSRYIEIELNFFSLIQKYNIAYVKKLKLKKIHLFNPTILIIPSKKDRISIYEYYSNIKSHPYIKNYEINQEKENEILNSGYFRYCVENEKIQK